MGRKGEGNGTKGEDGRMQEMKKGGRTTKKEGRREKKRDRDEAGEG